MSSYNSAVQKQNVIHTSLGVDNLQPSSGSNHVQLYVVVTLDRKIES